MSPFRVLIALRSLEGLGGLERYVQDLARSLINRGHQVVVYATKLGDAARALRSETIPVTDDLDSIAVVPTIIHGNGSLETMAALTRFPGVPALFVCHGWWAWSTAPPRFPRIHRYVAVDDTCRDRMLFQEAIPEEKLSVVLNAVDLERFPRRGPLPSRPARALVFSNYANEMTHVESIREACGRAEIALDVAGWSSGNPLEHPERVLGQYDLVFAKGKAAMEAMAAGAAVVLCDAMGMGTMVTSDSLAAQRRLNFGARALDRRVHAEDLLREVGRYDPADATRVSDAIRSIASHTMLVDEMLALYEEVIDEQRRAAPDPAAEILAISRYLEKLSVDFARPLDSQQLFPVLGLANRVLRTPVIGPAIRWIARRVAGPAKLGKS
ncbi:MAG TPA: glycosyltransferase family 4 protein [Thermoanaerobaculia bacterium]|nr:glycosyltransferase family 4 protein [Thermoanaerobaculia bacterium]